jgi:hypothetical protein
MKRILLLDNARIARIEQLITKATAEPFDFTSTEKVRQFVAQGQSEILHIMAAFTTYITCGYSVTYSHERQRRPDGSIILVKHISVSLAVPNQPDDISATAQQYNIPTDEAELLISLLLQCLNTGKRSPMPEAVAIICEAFKIDSLGNILSAFNGEPVEHKILRVWFEPEDTGPTIFPAINLLYAV